jgi:hypothetical protein
MHLATGCPLTAADATAAAAAAPDESGPAELRRSRRRPRSMRGWKAGSWPMSRPPFRLHAAPERHSNHAAPAVREKKKNTLSRPTRRKESPQPWQQVLTKSTGRKVFCAREKHTGYMRLKKCPVDRPSCRRKNVSLLCVAARSARSARRGLGSD